MPSVVANGDQHIAKRQRIENPTLATKPTGSRIFAPYRTLGLVSPTNVPFTSIPLGKTTFQLTTSTGRCLHTYDLRRGLQLVFITRPETPYEITATCSWKDLVFAAWGGGSAASDNGIWIFKRGKKVAELEKPDTLDHPLAKIIVFGSWIVGCSTNTLEVWKNGSYEHYTTIIGTDVTGSGADGFSGAICTMPTLLNKIIVGKKDGSLDIWNVNTGKPVYTIAPPNLECGQVTALEAAPALNLLAIGRDDGSIFIHDIRVDKVIVKLNQKSSHRGVSSISFRTDDLGAGEDGRKAGVMATSGSDSGDVTLWDLNNGGRVMSVLRNAHNPPSTTAGGVAGGVTKVEFLPGQAVVVTSGRDNSLKTWIFDEQPSSSIPRLLHIRSGHAAAVTRLNFLPVESDGSDAIGKWLLSAGRDQSLWGWSLRRDNQSTELSQGNIRKKARKLGYMTGSLETESSSRLEDLKTPEITCMACCLNRDGGMGNTSGGGPVWANVAASKSSSKGDDKPVTGWESIVTGHRGDKYARTWFWGRKKAGRWAFETSDGTEVKSVGVSPCGTFAMVGSEGGSIDMFNLQSGIHRQKFPAPISPAQARKLKLQQNGDSSTVVRKGTEQKYGPGEGKHRKEVTGLMVDSLNRTVISCGLDGKIKFWDFQKGVLKYEIDWHPMTAITGARYHRPSDLIALSCDDLSIRVVDIETRKLVRELWGCVGSIRDFCFSNDGRWIIAASMDSVIRVWDLPTGHLIDAVKVDGACTALAFSVTGEFLATAHANSIGINIWTNKALFSHVSTRHIDEDEVSKIVLPSASGEGGQGLLEAAINPDTDGGTDFDPIPYSTIDQLSSDITTLSLVPKSRWQTLVHLDTISARNKPIEPPKAPEKAPFFLPSLDKSGPGAITAGSSNETQLQIQTDAAESSRILSLRRHGSDRPFTSLLRATESSLDEAEVHEQFFAHVKSLTPAAADIELRGVDLEERPEHASEATLLVKQLTDRLRRKKDYEVVQAWMAVFLKAHGEAIPGNEELVRALAEWKQVQDIEGKRLGALVGYAAGVVGFLRSGR